MTFISLRVDLTNRFAASLFLLGKFIRFLMSLGFLVLLVSQTKVLLDYNLAQVILFFLTFNLIDIVTQLFLRGVYHFRPLIITGNFDLLLTKPVHPLFLSLFSHADILDFITLVPLIGFMVFFLATGQVAVTIFGVLLYLLLTGCALVIALALHIAVLAIGILTTEVDHLIWIYRDLSGMGKVPVDIYQGWLRSFLTFVVPVGVMMTFPAKALMGLLSVQLVIFSFFLAVVFLLLSFRLWNFALKRYTSASS